MQRVAMLVDAGHLFAQGSMALTGSSQPRHLVKLDEQRAVAAFVEHSLEHASGCSLLRIYWYDGVTAKGPSHDHEAIAGCNNVKLRLGFINSHGQQKGVDSLIVTDLIELARNKAISDAVLMAGDEDLRIGVQVAQSYGVRVHLLGIAPARASQSKQLRHEADTTHEWSKDLISTFMRVLPGLSTSVSFSSESPVKVAANSILVPEALTNGPAPSFPQCAHDFANALNDTDMRMVMDHWSEYNQVPKVVDGKLLASTRDRIKRDLNSQEKKEMRAAFIEAVQQRVS